mgnify:CR=1 FL=1
MRPLPAVRRSGFTLVEFVIYFGLIGLVMTGVVGFMLDYMRSYNKAIVISRTEQEARFGLARVLRAVRQATRVNDGSSVFGSASGVLSLDVPSAQATPTVFDLSGGALRIKEGAGAATALTSGEVVVRSLRFAKDGNGNAAITIEMTVGYASPSSDPLLSYAVSASGTAVIRKDL